MNRAMNLFFMGKGGVGKSTAAALFSTFLAQQGYRVLVVSLDPAHNQSDIFERPLSDDASEISPNLRAMEVDQEAWIRTYLKDVHHQIDRTYSYLTSFNLEKYFGVIKHSPGLEEYALILAFEHIQKQYAQWDYLIFDMPPTALSLKFFALPSLSLVWVEHLLALRQEIIQKRELITTITLLNKEFQRDKVLNKIEAQRVQYRKLKETFENPEKTRVYLVLNPDKLSHAESLRILNSLKEINIPLYRTVYNKKPVNVACAQIDPVFANIPMLNFPLSDTPLIGMDALQHYLQANQEEMENQLKVC
ncbi:MAG: ArsA family ATPase [Deltaproteobacteria bacterium]|nr:ArsA family ATPase [Deltaproteobacteria bacterium]